MVIRAIRDFRGGDRGTRKQGGLSRARSMRPGAAPTPRPLSSCQTILPLSQLLLPLLPARGLRGRARPALPGAGGDRGLFSCSLRSREMVNQDTGGFYVPSGSSARAS